MTSLVLGPPAHSSPSQLCPLPILPPGSGDRQAGAGTVGPRATPAYPGPGCPTCLPPEEMGVTPAVPSGVLGRWSGHQVGPLSGQC